MIGTRRDRSSDFSQIWQVMTLLQRSYGEFSAAIVGNLAEMFGVPRKATTAYIQYLLDVRAIERTEFGLRIVNAGEAPPMPATSYAISRSVDQAIWTAMRSLPLFRTIEIATAASTDELVVPVAAVMIYCKALVRAGYVAQPDRSVYRLLPTGNTGPRAPMVICQGNQRTLFDFNLMQTVNVTGRRTIRRAA